MKRQRRCVSNNMLQLFMHVIRSLKEKRKKKDKPYAQAVGYIENGLFFFLFSFSSSYGRLFASLPLCVINFVNSFVLFLENDIHIQYMYSMHKTKRKLRK